ncbi:MAG TPA: site-2 protease family protein [Pyrinomonadaceae bacterium]|jgi:Zn-dependent protease|nr:site-2 protease family protein [Pyrinomonadaceae bacterium]
MNFLDLFRRQIQVARVSGIPVRIDYRWFLVFALSAWVIAFSFREGTTMTQFVRLGEAWSWVAGIATTFSLFLSIFGHELSHALLARAEGIESDEIVLHPFGGLTRLRREPDSPRAEFRIAIAGPSASFLIGVAAFASFYVSKLARLDALAAASSIVGFWNFTIAASNLLPGYPLDGGRVLRAFLWKKTGQLEDATRIASLGGQLIGGALVVFGGWFYYRAGDPFMGLWLALVGFFLFDAARSVVRRPRGLRTAGEAMTAPVSVEPDTTVGNFIDNLLPLHRQEAVAVAHAQRLHGILTLRDIKQLPRERWHTTRVRDVMRPVSPELFVAPQTPLARAERLLSENGAGALAVVNSAGELVGLLLRGRLKRRVKVKS